MSTPLKSEQYRGFTLNVVRDEHARDPREALNTTDMICFHKRYNIGDKHNYHTSTFPSFDALREALIKRYKPIIIKPLYMYDHSGITISTKPFPCPWDSGQIGFVFISEPTIKRLNITNLESVNWDAALEREVLDYDRYLTNSYVACDVIRGTDELIDTCAGYITDYDEALALGRACVDRLIDELNDAVGRFSGTIICVDFDDTINDYPGWTSEGYSAVRGKPLPGAREGIRELRKLGYRVFVNSVRCGYDGGQFAVEQYLLTHDIVVDGVTEFKPPASVYLDDKGLTFTGDWSKAVQDVRKFKSWKALRNESEPVIPAGTRSTAA
jgi:hypothetical protein